MGKPRVRFEVVISVIPPLLGLIAASLSVYASRNILTEDDILRIKNFLLNPVSTGIAVVYGSVLVAILSIAMLLLVRSSERTRSSRLLSESAREPVSSSDLNEPDDERPLSAAEMATHERKQNLSRIRIAFTRTRRRMTSETERIQRNGLLNLTIGILFSAIALGILGYPLFAPNELQINGWIGLVEHFAPRFSVGILVQIIGFFFLRLYVAGENEVHYLRNELTNWEARSIAYFSASGTKEYSAMRDILKQLIRMERNFKLKKGELTLYATDETYNDMRQLLDDAFKRIWQEGRKSQSKSNGR